MKYRYDGYNWLVRLDKGEKLVESLTKLIQDQKITGAWISGLGACAWAELGFYKPSLKKLEFKKFNQELEILNLDGNVAWKNDQPALHIHGSFCDANMQAIGGHVNELEVSGTCEVLIHKWYKDGLKRKIEADKDTGLNLLDL